MKIGVIGDDFTGSGDIANTLARAGARVLQYIGIPDAPPGPDVDAAVISLKTRSVPVENAVAQSLAACRWLIAHGAEQIVFKYCSTFDSTPTGNIGPVAAALLHELDAPIALICPAFPANGRTIYQGHLFVRDCLLSESGMQKHPLTPMSDSDIRRWLGRQTSLPVGHLTLSHLRSNAAAEMVRLAGSGARLIVADAIDDIDLMLLGQLAARHKLVTGSSAVAMGLPTNFGIKPETTTAPNAYLSGPALILSGSCSTATRAQVEAYRSSHPALRVTAEEALELQSALAKTRSFIEAHRHAAPLIYSTDDPSAVSYDQARFGRDHLAASYDSLFSALASAAVASRFRKIVAAGGETSGAVATALGQIVFEIGAEIATGVPMLTTTSTPRLALALKSGNFGDRVP
ncbi:hypothetical protein AX760_25145 [Pararhizobium antarcticum]|uniref:3-oxo-tetronate kinase n=2 Tax=Pararhizobium antarcticum TaxID=1798805 RepID=A0A657LZH2_9HYPH|nr:3-oxo-tetronate kinase [Pararhizobium antarcticum]OJG00926.1 hypothetical protein AX760_25145 [Pararhizobium antarcticum]